MHAHPLTGWACRIIDCDTASRPKACVLLILSVIMMIVSILAAWRAGL